jgi:hypothetical protein
MYNKIIHRYWELIIKSTWWSSCLCVKHGEGGGCFRIYRSSKFSNYSQTDSPVSTSSVVTCRNILYYSFSSNCKYVTFLREQYVGVDNYFVEYKSTVNWRESEVKPKNECDVARTGIYNNKPADNSDFLDFSNTRVLISLEFLVCLKSGATRSCWPHEYYRQRQSLLPTYL